MDILTKWMDSSRHGAKAQETAVEETQYTYTKFLALDRPALPGSDFLQVTGVVGVKDIM